MNIYHLRVVQSLLKQIEKLNVYCKALTEGQAEEDAFESLWIKELILKKQWLGSEQETALVEALAFCRQSFYASSREALEQAWDAAGMHVTTVVGLQPIPAVEFEQLSEAAKTYFRRFSKPGVFKLRSKTFYAFTNPEDYFTVSIKQSAVLL